MSVPRRHESGQVMVIFAIMLPVFLAIGGIVIGVGNWYTHGKHLQTKADSGAFAGGTAWQFPCGTAIDTDIEAQARLYSGAVNPQVGGVPNASIHTVLNASSWFDDDAPLPTEFNDPAGSVCSNMTLDVKVTEDNSFPLFSLLPLFPDIKRKAVVEIQEVEGVTGLLPIAVRAPEPVSAAAVFYNEANGQIRAVKYFVRSDTIAQFPGGVQGWTTSNPEDASTWAAFAPTGATGVVIALSFRGACNTGLPSPNTKITTTAAPCFEDTGFTTVNELCNQGAATQIVDCYYAPGSWPSQAVQAGLHFIRGYQNLNPGNGTPALESAYIENLTCAVNGTASPAYFNAARNACSARLRLSIDAGTIQGDYPPGGPLNLSDLRAQDVQVRYRLVRSDGTSYCDNYGAQCDLIGTGSGSGMSFSTQGTGISPHLDLTQNSRANAVAVRVWIRNAPNHPNPDCRTNNFRNACSWFWSANGQVPEAQIDDASEVLAAPVQRAFRGNSVTSSGSIQWLRLTTDSECDGVPNFIDMEAASQQIGGNRCFFVEMGLKGGVARSANEPAILFNDGSSSNQTGTVDCDPDIPQGQELSDGVVDGCRWWYAKHPFNYPGGILCPAPNDLFDNGNPSDPNYNPGPPWDDGSWPPWRCIDTRQTGTANQLQQGLKLRLYGNRNQNTCPPPSTDYVRGRNYWDKDTPNGYVPPAGGRPLGYAEGTHQTNFAPGDPRIVTIFLSTTEAFTRPPAKTHPVTGFISVYITGFGTVRDAVDGDSDDPCPGFTPPPDVTDCQGPECNNYVVWGHILNYVIPAPNATPSGRRCNPSGSALPCVATLVE